MTLKERDKKHIWHPLTQHKLHPDSVAITYAQGSCLFDENGNSYIDAISSWYTCMYGHCNSYITEKIEQQLKKLHHVVFSSLTHEPAVRLSEELINILPSNQSKLFFSDNGSTSVEVALKMALQYHANQGDNRKVLIAFEDGFHGDTFGAMSVSGLSVYNGPFEDFFIEVTRIPTPNKDNLPEVLSQISELNEKHCVAGFIYEPLVQGAAAMKMYAAEHLNEILEVCQRLGILTIADEVMTGFGKTGSYFASDHMALKPDIICLSKALTAGIMPMAITSCSQDVYDAFYSDDLSKGFFHGHTYSANPLACAAALAGIELLRSKKIKTNINRIIKAHQAFNKKVATHHKVKSTRQCGIIYAIDLNIEMTRYGSLRDKLFQFFLDKGIFLRPLGNTIYIQAPYVISDEELNTIYSTIEEALDTF